MALVAAIRCAPLTDPEAAAIGCQPLCCLMRRDSCMMAGPQTWVCCDGIRAVPLPLHRAAACHGVPCMSAKLCQASRPDAPSSATPACGRFRCSV